MKNYAFKQFVSVVTLVIFVFVADYYIRNVNVALESVVLKQLILSIAISILLFICNQLIYNYAKNEERFMKHKLWNKMFIIILIWLSISFVVFIFLFFLTPLDVLISSHMWIMFIVAFYFLFFINMFILSIVHKVVDVSMKIEKKILITWASSSLLVVIILFVLPSV